MKNPSKVTIKTSDSTEERHHVWTWWYDDDSTLVIEYRTGEQEKFPDGNVVDE